MSLTIAGAAEAVRARLGLGAAAGYKARELAAGPGRHVLAYDFYMGARSVGRPVVAKLYPDAAGARAFAAMGAVTAALAARPGLLALPEPLFYDAGLRLLAMGRAEGEPLAGLARGPRAAEALRLVGRALAELHALPPPAGARLVPRPSSCDGYATPRKDAACCVPTTPTTQLCSDAVLGLEAHLADLIRPHPVALADQAPGLEHLVVELLAGLRAALGGPSPAAPVHRDVHLRQLFLGAGRVWLIDWDLFAAGDPALDVGNLCVYLRTHLGEDAPSAVAAMLEGYVAGGGAAALRRAPAWGAFTYMRLACKAAHLARPGWLVAARDLLERGLLALEEDWSDA